MIILNVTNGPPYSSSFPPRNMNCSILFLAILSTLLVVVAISMYRRNLNLSLTPLYCDIGYWFARALKSP